MKDQASTANDSCMQAVHHSTALKASKRQLQQQDGRRNQAKPPEQFDCLVLYLVLQAMMHVMTTQMLYGRFSDNPELKHPGVVWVWHLWQA